MSGGFEIGVQEVVEQVAQMRIDELINPLLDVGTSSHAGEKRHVLQGLGETEKGSTSRPMGVPIKAVGRPFAKVQTPPWSLYVVSGCNHPDSMVRLAALKGQG